MDHRDSNTPSSGPSGSSEWLLKSLLEVVHQMLPQLGQIGADVRTLASNQATNKADILAQVQKGHEHTNQRLDDLIPRVAKLEVGSQSSPVKDSSWAKSLFGSVGEFLLQKLPWKHLIRMSPGILIALFGHMMPERMKAAAVKILAFAGSIMEIFSMP